MFERITLIPNTKKEIPDDALKEVLDTVCTDGREVTVPCDVESEVYDRYDAVRKKPVSEIFDSSSMIIVMGGDGSVINAARTSCEYNIPIVGINFGLLGFLAELEISECDLLSEILKGNFRTEERMMLDVSLIRNGKEIKNPLPSLNETVLSNGPISRLTRFDLYCDGSLAVSYAADGMIISTPTGSSAYSMSAGGPIICPTMESIIATPICPHSFMQRPIVFTGDSLIEIKNPCCRENSMFVTVDGRENIEIFTDDVIRIKKSDKKTKLIRVKNGGFVSVLRRKLTMNDISNH